ALDRFPGKFRPRARDERELTLRLPDAELLPDVHVQKERHEQRGEPTEDELSDPRLGRHLDEQPARPRPREARVHGSHRAAERGHQQRDGRPAARTHAPDGTRGRRDAPRCPAKPRKISQYLRLTELAPTLSVPAVTT